MVLWDGDQVWATIFTVVQPPAQVLHELPGSDQPLSLSVQRESSPGMQLLSATGSLGTQCGSNPYLHFLACGYTIVPTSFVEKTLFDPLYCICSFLKDQLTITACSVHRICMSILLLIPHSLNYVSKSGNVSLPIFFFSFGFVWQF